MCKKVPTNINVQKILKVNELLAYVDMYIHQAPNLKIQMVSMIFDADRTPPYVEKKNW